MEFRTGSLEDYEYLQDLKDKFPRDTRDCVSNAFAGGAFFSVLYAAVGAGIGYLFGDAKLGAYIGAAGGFALGAPTIFMLNLSKLRQRIEREDFERKTRGIEEKVN